MEGMLAPEVKEEVTATIEVRETFHISKVGTVAGAMVREGKVKRTDKARLIRDGIVIFTGNINALKRFKDDVKEVATNFECGISLQGYNDIKVGDIIETFQEGEVKQRAYKLYSILSKQAQLLAIKADIQSKAREDLSQQQREHFLQQQIRTIQDELGNTPDDDID